MPELTGGQALVQSLKMEGVNTVFGLPGIQLDWAFDALWEERDSIREQFWAAFDAFVPGAAMSKAS